MSRHRPGEKKGMTQLWKTPRAVEHYDCVKLSLAYESWLTKARKNEQVAGTNWEYREKEGGVRERLQPAAKGTRDTRGQVKPQATWQYTD